MPALKNGKHEAFAQALAKGKSQDEAYVKAGFRRHDGNASRLRGDERITVRLAELREKVEHRTLITIESLTAELEDARTFAKEIGQASAAVSAIMGKAKLHGFLVERTETVNAHYHMSMEPISDEEWTKRHKVIEG